eukprot:8211745-Alexandrium_andersonii.AAC.1
MSSEAPPPAPLLGPKASPQVHAATMVLRRMHTAIRLPLTRMRSGLCCSLTMSPVVFDLWASPHALSSL